MWNLAAAAGRLGRDGKMDPLQENGPLDFCHTVRAFNTSCATGSATAT